MILITLAVIIASKYRTLNDVIVSIFRSNWHWRDTPSEGWVQAIGNTDTQLQVPHDHMTLSHVTITPL